VRITTMRIYGSNSTAAVTSTPPARRTSAAGGFSVTEDESARAASASAPLRTVGGIDALIALQGIEDATERRRHAVKRGRLALDALDELKVGLLGGELSPATLQKLKAVAAHLKAGSGEAGLDRVLAEIELRVEVEIAKMATP
jgi:Class II flagellar assembly regulator